MKTQKSKLVFGKCAIVELQSNDMLSIYGGTSDPDTCTPTLDPAGDKIKDILATLTITQETGSQ